MNPVTQAQSRYYRELGVVMALYLIALFGRVYALPAIGNTALAVAVKLSPIVPVLLLGWVIVRFYRRIDEYHQMRFLQVLAIATGIVVAVTASWMFLEDVGIPRLSNYGVFNVILAAYGIVGFLFRVNDGFAEGRIGKVTRALAFASILAAAGAALWLAIIRLIGMPGETAFIAFLAACVVPIAISLHLGRPA